MISKNVLYKSYVIKLPLFIYVNKGKLPMPVISL